MQESKKQSCIWAPRFKGGAMKAPPPITRYTPTIFRNKRGLCTIVWNTPDGAMPTDGAIPVAPECLAELVCNSNALVDAERLLGLRK